MRSLLYTGRYSSPTIYLSFLPWSSEAALPGADDYMPWGSKWISSLRLHELGMELVLKRFLPIFKSQPISIQSNDPALYNHIKSNIHDLNSRFLKSYIPIEWHTDFFSGYKWDSNAFFLDIQWDPIPGVDIKVPRELSRFQHIGLLAHIDLEIASNEFMLQVIDWIHSNPPGRGLNWACNMDVGLRAINLIWGVRYFQPYVINCPHFQKIFFNSIRQHGCHIFDNLDYYGSHHATGNHYLSNIAALIYIGACFPDIPEADLWLYFGVHQLISEIDRQILDDGVCHEASTSYHRLVGELFISCSIIIEQIPLNRARRILSFPYYRFSTFPKLTQLVNHNSSTDIQFLPRSFYLKLFSIANFTATIRKPSGLVVQWGDNDSGRCHKLTTTSYSHSLDHDHLISSIVRFLNYPGCFHTSHKADFESKLLCRSTSRFFSIKDFVCDLYLSNYSSAIFPQAGVAVRSSLDAFLFVSCGSTGSSGRGGHGHNDKNSFELSIKGLDFFVDCGCPFYNSNPSLRNMFRSTRMHNTLHIDSKEQNSFQHTTSAMFSLLETASPLLSLLSGSIYGSHDGFRSKHIRTFNLKQSYLLITDFLNHNSVVMLSFVLHPDVILTPSVSQDSHIFYLQREDTKVSLQIDSISDFSIQNILYGSGYLLSTPSQLLSVSSRNSIIKTTISWSC